MYEIQSKSYVDALGDLFFDVTFKEEDGTVMEKRLSVEQYVSLFSNNCFKKETFYVLPKLQREVLACRISSDRMDSFDAVVCFKAQKRPFSYFGQHYLLPFPTLISLISVRKGVRVDTKLFALKTDEPLEETPLMEYPFGNVNSGGGCCFGNIVVENLKGPEDALAVLDAFLCGDTNGDLYHLQNTKELKQGELIERLQKEELFPNELLKEEGKLTVGSLTSFEVVKEY